MSIDFNLIFGTELEIEIKHVHLTSYIVKPTRSRKMVEIIKNFGKGTNVLFSLAILHFILCNCGHLKNLLHD